MAAKQPGKRAVLAHHMAMVMSAETVDDLEHEFQTGRAALEALYGGWMNALYRRAADRLHYDAVIPRGLALADEHPLGHLLPRFNTRNRHLSIGDQWFRVGRGGNTTGVRYAWTYATEWARGALISNGLSDKTAKGVLDWWSKYPHRALQVLIAAQDPAPQDGETGR